MSDIQLSEREILVLEAIVRNYILTALPTGSRCISKMKGFDWSPATIRNIMGDLEEKGLIAQPHTSAGRAPTDKGYRFYVDRLVESAALPQPIQATIRHELTHTEPSDLHMLMEATSRALSKATDQMGIILSPKLSYGVFRHVHIYHINNHRYAMNVTIDAGFIKTIVVELETEVNEQVIEAACRVINERFHGKSLDNIAQADKEIFTDIGVYELGVIKLFIPSIKKMLDKNTEEEVFTNGETNILLKPEFFHKEQVSSVIEILEEKNMLMHFFREGNSPQNRVVVTIGGEVEQGVLSSFSVVKTAYTLGKMQGYLGIIGPKRMPYPLLISAVDYTSKVLGEMYIS